MKKELSFEKLAKDEICSKELIRCVTKDFNFDKMTPVQNTAIPKLLSNQDVAVEACTGSGKTLAFLLPAFQMLITELIQTQTTSYQGIGALIISPTRELANQIHEVSTSLSAALLKQPSAFNINSVLITGGKDVLKSEKLIFNKTSNIIIATPGRLHDLISRHGQNQSGEFKEQLKNFKLLILDEADVLLELGFNRSLEIILDFLPKQRRTGLFSATQTNELAKLLKSGLRNPIIITIKLKQESATHDNKSISVPEGLNNYYVVLKENEKLKFLLTFIQNKIKSKLIVFLSTCCCVDFYFHIFQRLYEETKIKVNSISLHGRMPQKKREKNLKKFTESANSVLFCTDVAARGIDFKKVNWILQFHPPQDPNFFIHRIGRTARAGRSGNSLTFLQPSEDSYNHFLENKGIKLSEYDSSSLKTTQYDILDFVKKEQFKDRLLLERGTEAFISHLRSYKEHRLRFIFRFEELDLLSMAEAFVLFQVPKLSELRESNGIPGFTAVDSELIKNIKFKDKAKETERQHKYKNESKKGRKKKKKKDKNEKNKDTQKKKKRGRNQKIPEDWEELAKEERLYKKLRKKKISKASYDQQLLTF